MRRFIVGSVIWGGCIAALTACGGGSGSSQKDFAAKADAICVQEAQSEVNTSSQSMITSYQQGTTEVDSLVAARESALSKLRALTAPAGEKAAYQAFLQQWPAVESGWRSYLPTLKQQLAARKPIRTAYDFGNATSNTAEARYAAYMAAGKAGLSACAGKLPAADQAALTSVNHKMQEQTGPWICTHNATQHFVAWSNGPQACIKSTQQAVRAASDQVHLRHLMGTGPLAQLIVIIPQQSGGPGIFSWVKQGGVWKFDDVNDVPSGLKGP